MTAPHRFRSHLRVAAMLCLLVAVPLLVPGCALYSDMKSATRDMDFSLSDPDTHLRKKIVFSAFENRSPFRQEDLLALFENTVRTAMAKDCPRALFLGPDNPGLPAELRKPAMIRPGLPDNMAIARAGRQIGANTVITGAILDISSKQERRGIIWFRKAKHFVQFTATIAAYDMETGAKLLDESAEDEIEIEEFDYDEMTSQGQIRNEELTEALREAAEDLAERACEKLQETPWKGFVIETGNVVQISAGQWAGFKPGSVFDVLSPGRTVDSSEGQQFLLPGRKVGQIEIISVGAESAEGRQISGEPLPPGSTLRVPAP